MYVSKISDSHDRRVRIDVRARWLRAGTVDDVWRGEESRSGDGRRRQGRRQGRGARRKGSCERREENGEGRQESRDPQRNVGALQRWNGSDGQDENDRV